MAETRVDKGLRFRTWERNLQRPEAALKQVGAILTSASQQAFKAQAFGKVQWKPRSVPNVFGLLADFDQGRTSPPGRRMDPRPALRDTGRLAASISFRLMGDAVEVGSVLPYASVHNVGGDVESVTITERVQKGLGRWLQRQPKSVQRQLAFLLNPKRRGTRLQGKVPARPFVGLTPQLRKDIREVVGTTILTDRS